MVIKNLKSATEFFELSFNERKSGYGSFSIAQFAQKTGVGVSSLKMILSGTRRPTVRQTLALASSMDLSFAEMSYLESLASAENAEDEWEKRFYKRALKEKRADIKVHRVSVTQKDVLTDLAALPLLVYLVELEESRVQFLERGDYSEAAEKLGIDSKHVARLIEVFFKMGVLNSDTGVKTHIVFDRLKHTHLQKNYLKARLTEASVRIDKDYESSVTAFSGYTFSADENQLIQLKLEMKELMEKYISAESESTEAVHIAQAAFQIYPVASLSKAKRVDAY
ncbi:MAG: hypothetical protein EOP05_02695 [Proteobacteria bacterium]|nr:MAG: hypothetical protein EOP05_02695 [Pseudomonadota bacterium]